MSPQQQKRHDELQRALIWAGGSIALLYVVIVAFVVYVFVHNSNVAKQQNETLLLLCNRTYNLTPIVDDAILNLVERLEIVVALDVKAGDKITAAKDRALLIKFQEDHIRLQDQLLQTGSPCRKVP